MLRHGIPLEDALSDPRWAEEIRDVLGEDEQVVRQEKRPNNGQIGGAVAPVKEASSKMREKRLSLPFSGRRIWTFILHSLGNLFILASLYGLGATFGPVAYQEMAYRYQRFQGVEYVVADTTLAQNQVRESQFASINTKKTRVLTPVDTTFGIIIPKIGANARIIANVDAGDHDAYMKALKQGVAHAVGTGLPGVNASNRNIYLFAHSTDFPWNVGRYNAIFYLIKELKQGDEIDIFFAGHRHIYIVQEKKLVNSDEVRYLTEPTKEEQLVLQTCFPPGTTLKRLLVIAKPKASVMVENDISQISIAGVEKTDMQKSFGKLME